MAKLTLSFKGKVLKVYHLGAGTTDIGRDAGCTVNIDSLALQPHHARIRSTHDSVRLEPVDGHGKTWINGKAVTGDGVRLAHGDVIQVGKHTLSYAEDSSITAADSTSGAQHGVGPREPPVDTPSGWLQVLTGPQLGRVMRLDRSLTRIGTQGVQTAVIARRNGGYFLSHLEGDTAPRVDNQPIGDETVQLHDGAVIQLGDSKLQFFLHQ